MRLFRDICRDKKGQGIEVGMHLLQCNNPYIQNLNPASPLSLLMTTSFSLPLPLVPYGSIPSTLIGQTHRQHVCMRFGISKGRGWRWPESERRKREADIFYHHHHHHLLLTGFTCLLDFLPYLLAISTPQTPPIPLQSPRPNPASL
jgi:hypothetical protein